ncbi:MAG: AAA family ATPase, partial [Lachnospiraceae bacterium]|nr:AAA family ATPase [Lachnospiraceae bacterium]
FKKLIDELKDYQTKLSWIKKYKDGVELLFNDYNDLDVLYRQGNFITAFFSADRKTKIIRKYGVEEVWLSKCYSVDSEPGKLLHKYMVHLKTQQSYARNEGDMANVDRIQKWFDRFVEALRVLLDDNSISLEYNYKEYEFKIHQAGRVPFGFDELSDGYSSVIHIVSDLILRMDKNWIFRDRLSQYDIEGIVLIDELETHLHIDLQKKIMPFLIKFFPRIQFIVTTHSPYILNSISNAKAYDLEKSVELENLSVYSSDGLVEGYFGVDEYSDELKEKIEKYKYLIGKKELTEEEHAERAKLRSELRNIPQGLSQEARDKFEEIEGKHL